MKEITFKSQDPFFSKEKSGIKNNTIRKISLQDLRFLRLLLIEHTGKYDEVLLKIIHSSSEDFFVRKIKDISVWDSFMIITWEHPNE